MKALVAGLAFLLIAFPGIARVENVVLIVVDDLGAHDLGCTGSTFHRTPHIDRLAAQGIRFTQAYSAATVCSPSRAAIMTGAYPARLKLTDWIRGHPYPRAKLRPPDWTQQLSLDSAPALPRRIAQHQSGNPRDDASGNAHRDVISLHLGKWHLGGEGFSPLDHGFSENLGGDHRGQPPSYFVPYGLPKLPDGPPGEYLTDREATEAEAFITRNRERPFFLNYWPYTVHTPLQAKADDIAQYRERAGAAREGQAHPTYAAMIESLDQAVGRILDTLDRLHLTEKTLVIFTSDNGGLIQGNPPPTSNAPLRSGKGSPYEGGHRVPLIVRWPGVAAPGSTCEVPVIGVDLLPTILVALGANEAYANRRGDGVSLARLIQDPQAEWNRENLFWHYPHYHPGGAKPYAAIRSGDWKLIQFYERGDHELYDLRNDPGETTNLAAGQPDRVVAMARTLFDWQNRVGAQWPMSNPGWEPETIRPQSEGRVILHSRDAFVRGTVLRYEPQPFKNTLGWWSRADDWVSWKFEAPQPGRYRVNILQGCGNGSGGSEVAFAVGASLLTMTVEETGGFQNFVERTIGEVELSEGEQVLEVRPVRKAGVAVMDLREVVLQRISETP